MIDDECTLALGGEAYFAKATVARTHSPRFITKAQLQVRWHTLTSKSPNWKQ